MGANHEENPEKKQKDGVKPTFNMLPKIPSFHGSNRTNKEEFKVKQEVKIKQDKLFANQKHLETTLSELGKRENTIRKLAAHRCQHHDDTQTTKKD